MNATQAGIYLFLLGWTNGIRVVSVSVLSTAEREKNNINMHAKSSWIKTDQHNRADQGRTPKKSHTLASSRSSCMTRVFQINPNSRVFIQPILNFICVQCTKHYRNRIVKLDHQIGVRVESGHRSRSPDRCQGGKWTQIQITRSVSGRKVDTDPDHQIGVRVKSGHM